MLEDAQSYVRVQNIYNPENFDRSLRPAAESEREGLDVSDHEEKGYIY